MINEAMTIKALLRMLCCKLLIFNMLVTFKKNKWRKLESKRIYEIILWTLINYHISWIDTKNKIKRRLSKVKKYI